MIRIKLFIVIRKSIPGRQNQVSATKRRLAEKSNKAPKRFECPFQLPESGQTQQTGPPRLRKKFN